VHWGSHYAWFHDYLTYAIKPGSEHVDALQRLDGSLRGGPKSRARKVLLDWLAKGDGRPEVWSRIYGPYAMAWVLTDDPAQLGREADRFIQYAEDGTRGGKPPKARHRSKTRDMKPEQLREHFKKISKALRTSEYGETDRAVRKSVREETGLKVEIDDGPALRRTLKMGLRVEKTAVIDDRAWVEVRGRNLDGSPYRYSVYLSKQPDGWRESLPTVSDWKTGKLKPPKDFARPLWFSAMPLGALAMYAVSGFVEYAIADPPDGLSHDFNLEAMWPALLELMRADELGDTKGFGEITRK
jgi:hypothetical protein